MTAAKLHAAFLKHGKTLALAESCTGGAIAAKLVAIPGASNFFLGSVVAYSNAWKETFLGVSSQTLKTKGAVSVEAVKEMVQGLFAKTKCDYAAAVSGIAGPENGVLCIAVGKRGMQIESKIMRAPEGRAEAIAFATEAALTALLQCLEGNP